MPNLLSTFIARLNSEQIREYAILFARHYRGEFFFLCVSFVLSSFFSLKTTSTRSARNKQQKKKNANIRPPNQNNAQCIENDQATVSANLKRKKNKKCIKVHLKLKHETSAVLPMKCYHPQNPIARDRPKT